MSAPLILLVNGNSREELTARMAGLARKRLDGLARVEPMTISAAPPYISNRAEGVHAASAILTALQGRIEEPDAPRPDAVMLACFGEPGLAALRQVLPMPVTGMVEASLHTAFQLGRRVSILTSGQDWPAQIDDLLDLYGLRGRVMRITALPDDAMRDEETIWRPALDAALERDARLGGAEAVILGGGPLAGRAAALTPPPGVRVIDAFDATLWQSLALAGHTRPEGTAR
ncbi:aspartate/glutamate racemase family protein [Marivita sp. GX14005]|uniref:aspartate/glutamate racemase family protein n=1 Tax=Marivita sp. GX14005 TaxID=2942276 RepID=UPI002019C349|nr:aspartate/glutamate racemase family protein [Marivita sp. GX14005]MCL3883107.1 aspartate/glutamate racemase family protein [Marivita sp. GX14005]